MPRLLAAFSPAGRRGKLDLVAEAFNLLNHGNVSTLDTVFGPQLTPGPAFATPIETLRPRQLQFSIDFEF